jgi:Zn-dependent protease with chaperone function
MVLLVVVSPVLIDPLFHRYEPLRDTRLREQILALAARAGIEGGWVYQVNMSAETPAVNAYVAGLGETKRIVLWDTLLARMEEEEILFVMGHEMGHYALGHVPLMLGMGWVGLFVALLVGDGAARRLLAWRGRRWEVSGMGDLASLPLLLAVLTALQFLGKPIVGGFSRAHEREADAFGLRLTGNGPAAARAFVKLSEENLSLPNPPRFVVFWHATHPPLSERIETALESDRQRS